MEPLTDEWGVVERLLPAGWQAAARELGAFRRARYLKDPATLLRVVLFHAVQGAGLRQSAALLRAAGVAQLSQVALFKRLRGAGDWLAWIAAGLCEGLRTRPGPQGAARIRLVDSTTVQGPAARGIDWRLHYAVDLASLRCDWQQVSDGHGGESLKRVPVRRGDVIVADRNFFTLAGMAHLAEAQADALIRLRWSHPGLLDAQGKPFDTLRAAGRLKTGRPGEWPVQLPLPGREPLAGRVVALRLPLPVAERARRGARRQAAQGGHRPDPRSLQAAGYVLLFTTLSSARLPAAGVLELYRYRWQVELAFKRLKQLLKLGRLPHQNPQAALGWIQAKLVVALLLETLLRNTRSFSPWGFDLAFQPG
jgi:hypothetical protein